MDMRWGLLWVWDWALGAVFAQQSLWLFYDHVGAFAAAAGLHADKICMSGR